MPDMIKVLQDKISILNKRIEVLERLVSGVGSLKVNSTESTKDISNRLKNAENFKALISDLIELSIPGDGKFLRAISGKYIPAGIEDSIFETINKDFEIASISQYYPRISISGYYNSTSSHGYLNFNASAGSMIGQLAQTANGCIFGVIDGNGINSSNTRNVGTRIWFSQDGSAGAVYIPGCIRFFTGTDAASPTERVRISSDGSVKINGLSGVGDRAVYADSNGKLFC
jgi:hypothetical protein